MKDIKRFIVGFKRFQDEYFCREDSPYRELNEGQRPDTMVIACSDSRTDPSIIMQCEPGEIFVVRNVANIVPPYQCDSGYHGVSSAIEYAVKHLNVANIVVLGHSSCGGIDTLMQGKVDSGNEFIDRWLSMMEPVRERVISEFGEVNKCSCTACEMAGIIQSVENLKTFPWIAERVEAHTLDLHAWYFDMESGQLLSYLPQVNGFEPLASACPGREPGPEYDEPQHGDD